MSTPLLIVKTLTVSQWARTLTEEGLTMEQVPNQNTMQYIPCRAELLSPNNDWLLSWRLCRLRSLSSETISFNFKQSIASYQLDNDSIIWHQPHPPPVPCALIPSLRPSNMPYYLVDTTMVHARLYLGTIRQCFQTSHPTSFCTYSSPTLQNPRNYLLSSSHQPGYLKYGTEEWREWE